MLQPQQKGLVCRSGAMNDHGSNARHVLFLPGNLLVFTEKTALREAPGTGSRLRACCIRQWIEMLVTGNSLSYFHIFHGEKPTVVLVGATCSRDATNSFDVVSISFNF